MKYHRYGDNPERLWELNSTINDYDFWFINENYTIAGDDTTYKRTGGLDLTANLSTY